MSRKDDCTLLNTYILVSAVTAYIYDFAALVGVPINIARSAEALNIFVITAGIEKYKSIIMKNYRLESTHTLVKMNLF